MLRSSEKTNEGAITFTRSIEPESSSIFNEWAAAYGIADQVDVPAMDFAEAFALGWTRGFGKV